MKNPYVGTIVLRKRHTYINDRTHGPFTFGHLKLAPLELTRILWVVSSFHVKPGQQRFLIIYGVVLQAADDQADLYFFSSTPGFSIRPCKSPGPDCWY